MVVVHTFDDPEPRRGKYTKIKQTLFDGPIDFAKGDIIGCSVRSLADGGIEIIMKSEDEFMHESEVKILIPREDLDMISKMRNQGLI